MARTRPPAANDRLKPSIADMHYHSEGAATPSRESFPATVPVNKVARPEWRSTLLSDNLSSSMRHLRHRSILQPQSQSHNLKDHCSVLERYFTSNLLTPEREVTGEIPKAQSCIAKKTSEHTRVPVLCMCAATYSVHAL